MEKLEQVSKEIEMFDNEKKKYPTVVLPEKPDPTSSQVHKNTVIQKMIDAERRRASERKTLEKRKKTELEDLKAEIIEMLQDKRDIPPPSLTLQSILEEPQSPQKASVQIFIGEFSDQEHEFMHNKIQSFYKQFFSSQDTLYFFKFEHTETDFEELNSKQFPPKQRRDLNDKTIEYDKLDSNQ